MPNRYPLVVNTSTGVIQELQAADGLELGNSNIANIGNLNVTGTANLGAVGNITITGGTSGQVLKTDGSGVLSWQNDTATPAGANTQLQFNDGGTSFGGSANLTFNKTSNTLTTFNANIGNSVNITANLAANNLSLTGVAVVTGNVTGGNLSSLPSGNVWVGGNLNLQGNASSINFKSQTSANIAIIQGPDTLSTAYVGWLLPNTQGNVGEFLTNTGNTNFMEWKTVATSSAPTSATDTGQAGQIAFDSSYIYVCVATNTWKRAAIASWP